LRILVADDHEAVRKGVCAILSSRGDIEICGEATNGREAVDKTIELKPDLVILDLTMPVLSGVEAVREIRMHLPSVPILVLSMHESKQVTEDIRALGVQGYVTKSEASTTLLLAVDSVLRNETFFPEQLN
jgi:DNA-binding NarL/FixJ family response regulator